MRAECLTMFGPNEEFDASKLGDPKRAPYLNACISEALRLMPAGPNGMQRVVNTAGGILVNDIHVPKGTKVNVHPWTLHHDARWFEKPWDFIPERWIEGSDFKGSHNPSASIPFALGAYSCIGKNLALMQIRMFLMKYVCLHEFFNIIHLCQHFQAHMMGVSLIIGTGLFRFLTSRQHQVLTRGHSSKTRSRFFGLRKEPWKVFAIVHSQ